MRARNALRSQSFAFLRLAFPLHKFPRYISQTPSIRLCLTQRIAWCLDGTGNQRHEKADLKRVSDTTCQWGEIMFGVLFLSGALMFGSVAAVAAPQGAAPTITATPAQNGAVLVSLATTTVGAHIYYTLDGSAPTASSQRYEAPLLIASPLTVKAAVIDGSTTGTIATKTLALHIAPGALVWSDEFTNATGTKAGPDPHVWTYETGNSGFGNHELEDYCAWGSNATPCSSANPNAYVDTDGNLHIVAQQPYAGVYTSARMTTQGLFSFVYGRFEIRAKVPEAAGFWPAGWTLGNNIKTVDWPASGEQDVLERVNAATKPDWNEGSIHGPGFTGDVGLGTKVAFKEGSTAADWHTYGMIWKKGSVAYYIDDPSHPYVTYTTDDIRKFKDGVWPFDAGQGNFILLNLAIGGDWPKSPNATTPFPSEMLVDYVRIYAN
jgi:beta-glucanase (GH16 family)